MAQKRITIKGLADYMTASASRQRTILWQFKYPNEEEAQAKKVYYREARERVETLHRRDHDSAWLVNEAGGLEVLAAMSTGRTKTRLRHNARGIRSYARSFSGRDFEVLGDVRLGLKFSDVLVSVVPDLHVRERGKEKLIKLEFAANEPPASAVQIISQGMFEAADQAGMGLPSSSILYLDIPRGKEHRGARLGSRMRRDMESACMSLSAIWDSL